MKVKWKKLIICLAIPLAVGAVAALLSGSGMRQYGTLRQPPFSPPGWLFPVVCTIMNLLMGYASYRVLRSGAEEGQIKKALSLYGAQLALNFLWPLIFFGLEMYLLAFIVILALWVLIFLTINAFSDIDETAGNLLLPYILWVTFAAYLNVGVYLLN